MQLYFLNSKNKKKRFITDISFIFLFFIAAIIITLIFIENIPNVLYYHKYTPSKINFSNENCTVYPILIDVQTDTPVEVYVYVNNYKELKESFDMDVYASLYENINPKSIRPINREDHFNFRMLSNKPRLIEVIQPIETIKISIKSCIYLNMNKMNNTKGGIEINVRMKPSKMWGYQGITAVAIFLGSFTLLFTIYKFILRNEDRK